MSHICNTTDDILFNHTLCEEDAPTTYGHTLNYTFSVVISIYFICLIVGGVVFNSVLIHAIIYGRNLHNIGNTFIVNLAICDLITATSTVPFDADFILRGHYNYGSFICGLKETVFMFSLPSSIFNLFLLTFERFIKILYPYHYKKVFVRRNVFLLLFTTWTYYGMVAASPLIYNSDAIYGQNGICYIRLPPYYITYQIVVNFSLPLICIMIMNLLIYRIARKHSLCIERQKSSLTDSPKRSFHRFSPTSLFTANYKAAKTIMILVGLFLVCWLSYIFIVTANVLCNLCQPREVTWFGNATNYSSIAFNPVLYGLYNKRIRKVITRNITTCFKKQSNNFASLRMLTGRTKTTELRMDEKDCFVNERAHIVGNIEQLYTFSNTKQEMV